MLSRWYVPSFSGDFRLAADESGVGRSTLTVWDPTPAELAALGRFLSEARKKKWIPDVGGLDEHGEGTLRLKVDIAKAGALLVKEMYKDKREEKATKLGKGLTVIASKENKVIAVYDAPVKEGAVDAEEFALVLVSDEAERAVTVSRPKLAAKRGDCPDTRASEVLAAFSTPQQYEQWTQEGCMRVYGHLSGHEYRLAHRKQDIAERQGSVAYDCTDGLPLAAYDWFVPPAEEVLAIKLYLENAEPWLRNRLGIVGEGLRLPTDVFPHPLGRKASAVEDESNLIDALALMARPFLKFLE